MEKNVSEIKIKPFPDKVTQNFLDSCVKHADGYNKHGVMHDLEFIDYLKNNYKSFRSREDYRMYNLYRTTRYFTKNKKCDEYFNNFKEHYGFKDMTAYILEYNEGAFAKVHIDNKTELTLVTLIDLDDNTSGGEVIAFGGQWELKKQTKDTLVISEDQWSKYPKEEKCIQLDIAPVVAELNINETISYGNKVRHGVSRLNSGRRVVLIQWCYFNYTRKDMGIE
jgi:hypothetical protein